ncbi:hypothetical protein [Brucella tritici]|uniref:hypothetical protein n=1 Tax=Brucella tritici TaxID=94626 RepID=UPI001F2370D6|nr:hypothetical protein [Brucella tritici]
MLKISFLTAGLWLSIVTLAHSAETVGFREVELDKESPRPLHVAIWYPTEERASTVTVGENRVFYGTSAVKMQFLTLALMLWWFSHMVMGVVGAT